MSAIALANNINVSPNIKALVNYNYTLVNYNNVSSKLMLLIKQSFPHHILIISLEFN